MFRHFGGKHGNMGNIFVKKIVCKLNCDCQQKHEKHILPNEMVRKHYKKPTLRSLAKRVRTLEKDEELKQFRPYSYSTTGTAFSTGLNASNPLRTIALNTPPRGDGLQYRTSDEIRCTSVHLSGVIYAVNGGTVLGYFNKVRILVFWDEDPMGEFPVLNGTSATTGNKSPLFRTSGSTVVYPFTQYNTVDAAYHQYKVIYDEIYTLKTEVGGYKSTDTGGSVNPEILFDIKIPLHRTVSLARSDYGDYRDLQTNGLYAAFITDNSGNTEIDMDVTTYFKDL